MAVALAIGIGIGVLLIAGLVERGYLTRRSRASPWRFRFRERPPDA
jgi:hypothetical protein